MLVDVAFGQEDDVSLYVFESKAFRGEAERCDDHRIFN